MKSATNDPPTKVAGEADVGLLERLKPDVRPSERATSGPIGIDCPTLYPAHDYQRLAS